MKMIVGLGNPGLKYSNTRHNLGFLVVKNFAKKNKVKINKKRFSSLIGQTTYEGKKLILMMPLTFMNLSAKAVLAAVREFDLGLDDILVVCDDMNLPLGKIRIRPKGTAGGHNGLESIIKAFSSGDFARLRIGIDSGEPKHDLASFVLSNFNRSQKKVINESIEDAVSACQIWAAHGVNKAMNMFSS